MATTLSIIAFIIAIVALVVALSVYSRAYKFNNYLLGLDREQVSINNLMRGLEKRIEELEKEE